MRRPVPTRIDLELPTPAAKHAAGMSCLNPAAYSYDANGHRRWCIDCGAPLGLQPDPADRRFNTLVLLPFFLGLLAAGLIWFAVSMFRVPETGAPVTPTTYGPPAVVHSGS